MYHTSVKVRQVIMPTTAQRKLQRTIQDSSTTMVRGRSSSNRLAMGTRTSRPTPGNRTMHVGE